MYKCNDATLLNLQLQAECEMAAFLKAASDVLGPCGRWVAADAWLSEMDSLNWPIEDHQKFFRSVSIRAISQIAADSYSTPGFMKPRSNEEHHGLKVLQGGR